MQVRVCVCVCASEERASEAGIYVDDETIPFVLVVSRVHTTNAAGNQKNKFEYLFTHVIQ